MRAAIRIVFLLCTLLVTACGNVSSKQHPPIPIPTSAIDIKRGAAYNGSELIDFRTKESQQQIFDFYKNNLLPAEWKLIENIHNPVPPSRFADHTYTYEYSRGLFSSPIHANITVVSTQQNETRVVISVFDPANKLPIR